jgi:hypothetical protein
LEESAAIPLPVKSLQEERTLNQATALLACQCMVNLRARRDLFPLYLLFLLFGNFGRNNKHIYAFEFNSADRCGTLISI